MGVVNNEFQSTHSLRSATDPYRFLSTYDRFQSTHSLRSATIISPVLVFSRTSFNPRTPCGVRLALLAPLSGGLPVSIHALLAECDSPSSDNQGDKKSFNPRTPCGVRLLCGKSKKERKRFQSTHSLRSATPASAAGVCSRFRFQSTHSLRSATYVWCRDLSPLLVSIHALLAECDIVSQGIQDKINGFNPRTPCGVRPRSRTTALNYRFQSTHSLRSATGQ